VADQKKASEGEAKHKTLAEMDEDEALNFNAAMMPAYQANLRAWPRDFADAEELKAHLATIGMTVAQFKALSVYRNLLPRFPWLRDL
jgi:ABC-type antimicrobial peptide transport system ATPase subunit